MGGGLGYPWGGQLELQAQGVGCKGLPQGVLHQSRLLQDCSTSPSWQPVTKMDFCMCWLGNAWLLVLVEIMFMLSVQIWW